MADNVTLNSGSGGDTIAADDVGGAKYQYVKPAFGADGTATIVSGLNPLPITPGGADYETVAASQTDQILGATGAVGDYLNFLLVVPATTSPGAVSIKDGNGSAVTVFTGGASSVSNLVPFPVPVMAKTVNATTPGWKVTTGANVSCVGIGKFT